MDFHYNTLWRMEFIIVFALRGTNENIIGSPISD